MKISEYSEKIGELIGKDELDVALIELRTLLKGSPKLKTAIIHTAQYNDLMRQMDIGVVSDEKLALSKNKIRLGILNLLAEIEGKFLESEVIQTEVQDFLSNQNTQSIQNSKNVIIDSGLKAGGDIIIGGSKTSNLE